MKRFVLSIIPLQLFLAAACSCGPVPPTPDPEEFDCVSPEHVSRMEKVKVTVSGTNDREVTVDWGDGTVDSGKGVEFVHAYSAGDDYEVTATCGEQTKTWTVTVGNLLALSVAVPELVKDGRVWVMAHRAHTSNASIPENSISAVNAAIAAGADVLETDTHITKDSVVVICHDKSVKATTNGLGNIPDMTLAQIKILRLKDRKGKLTSEKMPTLEEFLLAARDRAYVNLDYSPRTATAAQVWEVVRKLGMVQQVFMYCNTAAAVEDVLSIDPEANVYSKHDCYQALPKVPNKYMIQARWYISEDETEPYARGTAEAVREGYVSTANMLFVLDKDIPEYSVNDTYLNALLQAFPDCHMIQNDCPDILVPILAQKGLR